MSNSDAPVVIERSFVSARLKTVRQIEETLSSPEDLPRVTTPPQPLKTETTTTIELGLPDDEKDRSTFQVSVTFAVTLSTEPEVVFARYKIRIACVFEVVATSEAFDWSKLSSLTVEPYYSFAHFLARQSADACLYKAGFRGVYVPVPNDLGFAEHT